MSETLTKEKRDEWREWYEFSGSSYVVQPLTHAEILRVFDTCDALEARAERAEGVGRHMQTLVENLRRHRFPNGGITGLIGELERISKVLLEKSDE